MQNKMKSKLVYLAGPIDATSPEIDTTLSRPNWRKDLGWQFSKEGLTCYNPYQAFESFGKPDRDRKKKVIEINRFALSQCDILVVFAPSTIFSVGTYREIEYSVRSQPVKPIFVWTDRVDMVEFSDCHFLCQTRDSLVEAVLRYAKIGHIGDCSPFYDDEVDR